MTKQERMELNELSKKLYGVSSKWQTLLRKGRRVYNEKLKYTEVKYLSVDEIKAEMQETAAKPTMKEITDLITSVDNNTQG